MRNTYPGQRRCSCDSLATCPGLGYRCPGGTIRSSMAPSWILAKSFTALPCRADITYSFCEIAQLQNSSLGGELGRTFRDLFKASPVRKSGAMVSLNSTASVLNPACLLRAPSHKLAQRRRRVVYYPHSPKKRPSRSVQRTIYPAEYSRKDRNTLGGRQRSEESSRFAGMAAQLDDRERCSN